MARVALAPHEVPKYWFVKTVTDGGKTRVKLLPNQYVETSPGSREWEECDTSFNITCDKTARTANPIGTVFAVTSLEKCPGFYQVKDRKLHVLTGDKIDASPDMIKEYGAFLAGTPRAADADGAEDEPVAKVKSTYLSRLKAKKEMAPPTIDSHGFHVNPDIWYFLLRNINNCENTMLIGPTGCGKTEIVSLACSKQGVPLNVYDMGAMHDPISGLLGVHRLQGGASVFDFSKFSQDIQKEGAGLLDELSRAPASANNLLFPCLDSRRELPVEIAGSHDVRNCKVHDDFCFLATANIGVEYTGTSQIDRALLDRFTPIELGYMDKATEARVLMSRTEIEKRDADFIASIAEQIRQMASNGDISSSVSTRHTLSIAKLVKDGFDRKFSLQAILLPLFEGTQSTGERSRIFTLLAGR